LSLGTYKVLAIDNFDDFYPKEIKLSNIKQFSNHTDFYFIEGDILDNSILDSINEKIDVIVHLAAKAGVRPSIKDPFKYQKVNEAGTLNLLEFAKNNKIQRFIFASSSSVYGVNKNVPWNEDDKLLTPISPYAATKLSSEMMGNVYSYLFNVNFIALRFFTVYGPGQRPDLAIHKFFYLINANKEIEVYGDGSTYRDYTFVDDIVDGVIIKLLN
jgi:UDP-glucuronate 4-epimerase